MGVLAKGLISICPKPLFDFFPPQPYNPNYPVTKSIHEGRNLNMFNKLFLNFDRCLDFFWKYLPEFIFLAGLIIAALFIYMGISFSNAILNSR
jgi:hypothetical protein